MIKKIPFLILLVIAFASCESTSIEDEMFNQETSKEENNKPEIMHVHEENTYGLRN